MFTGVGDSKYIMMVVSSRLKRDSVNYYAVIVLYKGTIQYI